MSWAIRKGWPLTRQNLERLKRTFQYGWTKFLVWAMNSSCHSVALMAGVTTIVSIVKMPVLFALVRIPADCNCTIVMLLLDYVKFPCLSQWSICLNTG